MGNCDVWLKSYPSFPRNYVAEAPNTTATITLPAGARFELTGVAWSYSDTPTAGRLTIMGGGFSFDIDITDRGPGFIPLVPAVHATDNNPIVVTLYAGGADVVGKLNLLGTGPD